jgi:hypothetical protein
MNSLNLPIEPFMIHEQGDQYSLLFIDRDMVDKMPIFEERSKEGWSGNGYDWTSIAHVVLAEQFSGMNERINFDSEAGMLCALGSKSDIEALGGAMAKVFYSDELLRDLLGRAELD